MIFLLRIGEQEDGATVKAVGGGAGATGAVAGSLWAWANVFSS